MTIQVGEKIPSITLRHKTDGNVKEISTDEVFSGKKVVLIALPGAFTPTCSAAHLPGYLVKSDELFARGIDRIVCLSVNDAHVMTAWGENQNVEDRILMLADGNAEFTHAIGMQLDRSSAGMGIRSKRYAMLVNDGTVEVLNLEADGKYEISDAETLLKSL